MTFTKKVLSMENGQFIMTYFRQRLLTPLPAPSPYAPGFFAVVVVLTVVENVVS